MMFRSIRKLMGYGVGASSVLWAMSAQASGFATARFGGEHGYPVTDNATAIYYNPAGLALSEGIHLFVDGNFALRGASYSHQQAETDAVEPEGAEGSNNGEGTLFNVVAAPMLGASAKFGDFAIGGGFYVPIGGTAIWDKNDQFEGNEQYPGLVDGVQRWYAIEGTIRSFYLTLAAAYQIPTTGLSIGISGNLIRSEVDSIRARDADGSNTIEAEGRSYLNASGWQGSFGVGAIYEAVPRKLWFGASYQARPNISGGMELEGTLKTNYAGLPNETDVYLKQDLPDVIRLGARFAPSKEWEFRLFGDYTRWSAFKDQCIGSDQNPCGEESEDDGTFSDGTPIQNLKRNWEDAFGVRAGASYWVQPTIEVFGGLGYDGNAIPDETLDASLMDFHDISISGGGRFELTKNVHAALSYTQFISIARDNTGKSEGAVYEQPSTTPDAGGEYSQWIGVVNANIDIAF